MQKARDMAAWGVLICFCSYPALAETPQNAPGFAEERAGSIRLMRESIARQRESVRGQAPRVRPADPAPEATVAPVVQADCEPIAEEEAAPMIAGVAKETQVDPDLLRAVIRQESGFRPCAVSDRGSLGLMQLMPDAMASLCGADPFDPRENIRSDARFLRQMLEVFKGDEGLALAAYNVGPAKVEDRSYLEIPGVQQYVERILADRKSASKSAGQAK